MLLLLLLLLSKGACAVTPLLLANKAGIKGARKSKTKWGSDVSWRGFFFSSFSFSRIEAFVSKILEAVAVK